MPGPGTHQAEFGLHAAARGAGLLMRLAPGGAVIGMDGIFQRARRSVELPPVDLEES